MASEDGVKTITVFKANLRDETAYFIIKVTTGTGMSWCVQKRYSQFEELHTAMFMTNSLVLPAGLGLPPKKFKLFTSHITPKFIEERRCLLQAYLQKCQSVKQCAESKDFSKFLNSDKVEGEDDQKEEEEAPEDVEITDISIPSTRSMTDHVLYQIDLVNSRKRKSFSKWTVLKRFGQIYDMDAALRQEYVDEPAFLESLPAPPERKMRLLSDHMDDAFVESRRVLLENYFTKMIKITKIVQNTSFLKFLGVQV